MAISQCPGQDKRFWKPDDIFESPCPECGAAIEFWKDDVRRRCRGCGATVANPRFDMGCAAWCKFAEQCLGASATFFLQAERPQPRRMLRRGRPTGRDSSRSNRA